MKIIVLYVGSSLLAPLRNAEREINQDLGIDLRLAIHNFGAHFNEAEWATIENNLNEADVLFVIHVMDGENAARLLPLLDRVKTAVVINCMPELMKRTRMGKLDFAKLPGLKGREQTRGKEPDENASNGSLLRSITSWIGRQAKATGRNGERAHGRAEYLKWADRLPGLLRFVPNAGPLRDAKNYLLLVSYFLQPTPNNIKSMILLAAKEYAGDERLRQIEIPPPDSVASVAIYHPDASTLFESFEDYERWYAARSKTSGEMLDPKSTIGLLLMRPQIVSNSRKHYDALVRAIEAQGLSVIPAISTLMDNREACEKFFVNTIQRNGKRAKSNGELQQTHKSRVSQIVSLTGFSFVGGPAMNDSVAAAEFLLDLNRPYRSAVSLDMQTIESWTESQAGLNPVQAGMQISIPEIDGATEPLVYGGLPANGVEPLPLEDRCKKIARRLKRLNHLRNAPREELNIALVLFCFPPNKGNIGTAADLDVIPSVFDTLTRMKKEGYAVELPASPEELRSVLLDGNSEKFGSAANVVYRMNIDEYR